MFVISFLSWKFKHRLPQVADYVSFFIILYLAVNESSCNNISIELLPEASFFTGSQKPINGDSSFNDLTQTSSDCTIILLEHYERVGYSMTKLQNRVYNMICC